MWQDQKQTSNSPFDCAVCGAYVYGNLTGIRICLPCKSFFRRHAFLPPNTLKCNKNGTCYIEAAHRYFSASLPPCRACRLKKCLSIGMDQYLLRKRSASSPPLELINRRFNNTLIKTSSLDENVVLSIKEMSTDIDRKLANDDMKFNRVRSSSDIIDRQKEF
ncbi:unnamed protein product [Rotaria sordida]|uniref:Nuclear receptor domain-containing protein n=1 Tax=Rotaria sordida TaxID=392033 RepID=A0A813Y1I9_9BILA|nr:unnamed protein product [Rotaria sordida]CAF0803193.1 unnamed protein product [Rotaria sordida]CAF0826952.1 unnamed protein product [Rotaria sordida]CAF0839923.1 unnamed protein product [Rotaria sordida]CAF0840682.1 unnamed protein product [Rotaria sordida]